MIEAGIAVHHHVNFANSKISVNKYKHREIQFYSLSLQEGLQNSSLTVGQLRPCSLQAHVITAFVRVPFVDGLQILLLLSCCTRGFRTYCANNISKQPIKNQIIKINTFNWKRIMNLM